MTQAISLPAKLDLTAARPLAKEIAESEGPVILDAAEVAHLGGLCLQQLLAAAQMCRRDGRVFELKNASDAFQADLAMFGVDASTLKQEDGE